MINLFNNRWHYYSTSLLYKELNIFFFFTNLHSLFICTLLFKHKHTIISAHRHGFMKYIV